MSGLWVLILGGFMFLFIGGEIAQTAMAVGGAILFSCKIEISDGSGMEKVGFGRIRVYPNFQMYDSGMSGIGKVRFGQRVLKFLVSGIFR